MTEPAEWIVGSRYAEGYHGIVLRRSDMHQSEGLTALWARDAATAEVLEAIEGLARQLKWRYPSETLE